MPSPLIDDSSLRRVFAAEDLSFAAKGVLAFVLTRPPGARVGLAELFGASSDSMPTITAAVKELARTGLVGIAKPGRGTSQLAGAIALRSQ